MADNLTCTLYIDGQYIANLYGSGPWRKYQLKNWPWASRCYGRYGGNACIVSNIHVLGWLVGCIVTSVFIGNRNRHMSGTSPVWDGEHSSSANMGLCAVLYIGYLYLASVCMQAARHVSGSSPERTVMYSSEWYVASDRTDRMKCRKTNSADELFVIASTQLIEWVGQWCCRCSDQD
jgi:hypothetical protein